LRFELEKTRTKNLDASKEGLAVPRPPGEAATATSRQGGGQKDDAIGTLVWGPQEGRTVLKKIPKKTGTSNESPRRTLGKNPRERLPF